MTSNELATWILYAEVLRDTAGQDLDARSKAVGKYTEKAVYYLQKLCVGRSVSRLVLRDVATNNAEAFFPTGRDLIKSHFLVEYLLRLMRGLNFLGIQPAGGRGMKARQAHVFKMLAIEQPGSHPAPGDDENLALARYKIWSKLRQIGQDLRKKGLVVEVAKRGDRSEWRWEPCCDQFNDPSWRHRGGYPHKSEPSTFPGVPAAGFMLGDCEEVENEDVPMEGE